MKTLVCFLEESSARAMLEGIFPRLIDQQIIVRYIVFEGKQDLEKQLEKKLRGWLQPNTVFMVMRDQDSGNCVTVKERIAGYCKSAGKNGVLIRIACHELETFYLGDLGAVERALEIKGLQSHSATRKFRTPDRIAKPSIELQRLTGGKYQKVSGSRAIGVELDLAENRSESFLALISGLRRLVRVQA